MLSFLPQLLVASHIPWFGTIPSLCLHRYISKDMVPINSASAIPAIRLIYQRGSFSSDCDDVSLVFLFIVGIYCNSPTRVPFNN